MSTIKNASKSTSFSDHKNSLSDFLPENMISELSLHLGPGWEFHVEQELKTRDPHYIFFSDYSEDSRLEVTHEFAELISSLISDLIVGEDIMNADTRQALYNWTPSFLVRDLLREHPDWTINCITVDGKPCVVNVGRNPSGFRGVNIPHSSTNERKKAYSAAIMKMTGGIPADQWVCSDCTYKGTDSSPPIPKLSRRSAEPLYACYENFQSKCIRCNQKFVSSVGFN